MTFGMKKKGYSLYYLCEGAIRVSQKGYRILTITSCREISKTTYYKLPCPRFNRVFDPNVDREIHGFGEKVMLDTLEKFERQEGAANA